MKVREANIRHWKLRKKRYRIAVFLNMQISYHFQNYYYGASLVSTIIMTVTWMPRRLIDVTVEDRIQYGAK